MAVAFFHPTFHCRPFSTYGNNLSISTSIELQAVAHIDPTRTTPNVLSFLTDSSEQQTTVDFYQSMPCLHSRPPSDADVDDEDPLPVSVLERSLCDRTTSNLSEEAVSAIMSPVNTDSTELALSDDCDSAPSPRPTTKGLSPKPKSKEIFSLRLASNQRNSPPQRNKNVTLNRSTETQQATVFRAHQEVCWRFLVRDLHGLTHQSKDRRILSTLQRYPDARAELVASFQEDRPHSPTHFLYIKAKTWDQMRWIARDIDRIYPNWGLSHQLTRRQ